MHHSSRGTRHEATEHHLRQLCVEGVSEGQSLQAVDCDEEEHEDPRGGVACHQRQEAGGGELLPPHLQGGEHHGGTQGRHASTAGTGQTCGGERLDTWRRVLDRPVVARG